MVCLIQQKVWQLAVQTRLVIILILIGMHYSLPGREETWELNYTSIHPGVAIVTINSTKTHESIWKYILFSHVSEEGWVKRGGKGEGGCGEIFL